MLVGVMEPDASAYHALGLAPGADAAAVEKAYRHLIKLYHPDRGGDPGRAAEINSAYQQLRWRFGMQPGRRSGPPVPVRPQRMPRHRRLALPVAFLACAAIVAVSERDALGEAIAGISLPVIQPWPAQSQSPARGMPPVDLALAPIDAAAIDRSIIDASDLAAIGGEERLARQSRACHRQLRADPEPSRLDRCIAFDEAAVAILGGDPFRSGPFGASAVTARHLASARLLSSDALEVESRLKRIRTYVELALAPADPPPPPAGAGD